MEILVDTREKKPIYSFLTERFPEHTFKWQKLDEGDFDSGSVLVERKTIADLYGSIMGVGGKPGRLSSQLSRLATHDDRVLFVLITGSIDDYVNQMKEELGVIIKPDILIGAIASISCRERIHIMWIQDHYDGLVEMVRFMQGVEEGKYMVPSRREPDNLLARYFGVTINEMKELKMRFGSLQNIMNASEKDLQKVSGIGKAKSARIKDLLTRTW